MSELVTTELRDGVAVVTLGGPPANALSYGLIAALDDAVSEVVANGAAVLVFTSGLDRFFAAGADLKLLGQATASEFHHYLVTLRSFIEGLHGLDQPSIAAIDGMALGGGLELALACTMRTASPRSQLGLPEIKLGLLPGAGGTQRLPALIGRGPALDLLVTGRSIDGARAYDLGLVDRLVAPGELMDETMQLALAMAHGASKAVAAIRRCVDASTDMSFADGMAIEADEVERLFATADAREGIAAFLERREPTFE